MKMFTPHQAGAFKLAHRVVHPPLTRMRATEPTRVVAEGETGSGGGFLRGRYTASGCCVDSTLTAEYYSQRASPGGLLYTV